MLTVWAVSSGDGFECRSGSLTTGLKSIRFRDFLTDAKCICVIERVGTVTLKTYSDTVTILWPNIVFLGLQLTVIFIV